MIRSQARFVEPDDPVSQGLAVHPAGFGGLLSRGAVEHSGDRQEPACLRDIPGALRQPTKSLARVVRTHRKWMSHGKRPPFAMLNHCPADLGIPSESADLRVGIILRTAEIGTDANIAVVAQIKASCCSATHNQNIPAQSRIMYQGTS